MRNLSFPLIILLFQAGTLCAQAPRIDKNRVMDFFQNMQYEEAINYLLASEKTDSVNLPLLGYLGYAYQMNDDLANAGKYYQKMLDIDSNNLSANQYFSNLYSNTEPEKAQKYVYRLMKSNPQKAIYYRKMGDLLRRRNQKDSAFTFYDCAFQLAPNDTKNGAALADLLIDQKNYLRADSIIDEGIVKDSLSVPYLKLRVRSSYDAKAYHQVLIPGERLIRLKEGSLTTLTQVALSYYNLKLYKDCIRVCDFLVANGLAGESVFYYAAKSYAKLRDFDKSNELLETCLGMAISKTAEFYFHALGENYEELKQYKKAIAQYDTAYYLFKDPVMLYNCGRILDGDLKNYGAAKKYYNQYLVLARPESMDEKKAYEYIKRKYLKK
jgi:tetratricopeptide (TPR) repeat protein